MAEKTETLYGRTKTFTLPSGYQATIREQNGEDDDILSNPVDAQTLMNISRFVSRIVVGTDITPTGLLTKEDVQNMPALDRYAIMIHSRIFSIGKMMDFRYTWFGPNPNEKREVEYEVDIEDEFLFSDYSKAPTEEELEAKPNALPYYPFGKNTKDLDFSLQSGKKLRFDLLTPAGEAYMLNLPENEKTRNQGLKARNLCLLVNDIYEPVQNFSIFSRSDMAEIRSFVFGADPIFQGSTTIQDPLTKDEIKVPVVGGTDFFFPREN